MTFSRNFAIYLQLCGLAFLPTIRAQDSYTEASFPQPLLLKPGITQISGGVTTADQADAFHYRTSHPGSVTVRLRYQHRNANVIMGIRELPHLSGDLDFGYYVPSLPFFSSNLAPPATLSSPFYLTNGANTISATVPTVTDFDATARLRVSAPAGKTHPDYTVEIDYQPVLDPWEAGSGNESAPTAFVIDATTPGSLTGGTHSATDADWFRFTVPAGRSLQLRITSEVLSVPWEILPHQCVLHNASAIPLQTGNSGHVSFIENSGTSAQTYLLRITSQDSYAQEWQMSWGLQDTLEPNNTPAQASFLGTIQPQGRIEIPDLTLLDPDHFTVLSELPANTPILIAALPDPMISIQGGARVSIQSGGGTYQEYLNYTIVTTSENGTIGFNLSGSASRYRLLIKPRSDYDIWQLSLGLQTSDFPLYIPASSDFDSDGIPAALEWALRLSPFTANPGSMPPPYFDGSNWRLNLPMPAGGAAADILATESEDLVRWTDFPASRNNLGGSVISTGRLAGAVFTLNRPGAARNFLRFSVND